MAPDSSAAHGAAAASRPRQPAGPTLLARRGASPSAGRPPQKPRGARPRPAAAPAGCEGERGPSSPSRHALPAVDAPGGDVAGKGAISLLQEFVQCSKQFHVAPHRQILQWSFDQRMVHNTKLEFRALVAFALDGVPHHAAGAWHASKKLAQRDAAERALGFFVTAWAEALLAEEPARAAAEPASGPPRGGAGLAGEGAPEECKVLEDFCGRIPVCGGPAARPRWSVSWDGGNCRATVEIEVLGVVHKFAGAWRDAQAPAQADAARRVLWYLGCPGFGSLFELDQDGPAMAGRDIPLPPPNWATDDSENRAIHNAERRTIVMRLQNRLQQALAGQLRPGQGVWEWTYETDGHDSKQPPLCRAAVCIPAVGRIFTGSWESSQREAQIATSQQVAAFLDAWEDHVDRDGASVSAGPPA